MDTVLADVRKAVNDFVAALRRCHAVVTLFHQHLSAEPAGDTIKRLYRSSSPCAAQMRESDGKMCSSSLSRARYGCVHYCKHHDALLRHALVRGLNAYAKQLDSAAVRGERLQQRIESAASADDVFEVLTKRLPRAMRNWGRNVHNVYAAVNVDALRYFLGHLQSTQMQRKFDAMWSTSSPSTWAQGASELLQSGIALQNAADEALKMNCLGARVAKLVGQMEVAAKDWQKVQKEQGSALLLIVQKTATKYNDRVSKAETTMCERLAKAGGVDVCNDRVCSRTQLDMCATPALAPTSVTAAAPSTFFSKLKTSMRLQR